MNVAEGELSGSSTTSTLTCNAATDIQLVFVNGHMEHSAHSLAPIPAQHTLLTGGEFTSYFDYTASVSDGDNELVSLDTATVDPGNGTDLQEAYGVNNAAASTTLTLTVTPKQPSAARQSGPYDDTLIVMIDPR
jgi:hypothetical protein